MKKLLLFILIFAMPFVFAGGDIMKLHFSDGTTTINGTDVCLNDGTCLKTVAAGASGSIDWSKIQNFSDEDCPAGEYVYSRLQNGSWECRADQIGTGSYNPDNISLVRISSIDQVNQSWLNASIDARITGTDDNTTDEEILAFGYNHTADLLIYFNDTLEVRVCNIHNFDNTCDYIGDGLNDSAAINRALLDNVGKTIRVMYSDYAYQLASTVTVPSNTRLKADQGVKFNVSRGQHLYNYTANWTNKKYIFPTFTNLNHDTGNTNIVIENIDVDWGAPTGEVTKFDIGASNYAAFWFENVNNSMILDSSSRDVVYDAFAVGGNVPRCFGVLFTNTSNSIIMGGRHIGSCYEGIGFRGGNFQDIARDVYLAGHVSHAAQMVMWAENWEIGNQGCLFDHLTTPMNNSYHFQNEEIIYDGQNDQQHTSFGNMFTNLVASKIRVIGGVTGLTVKSSTTNLIEIDAINNNNMSDVTFDSNIVVKDTTKGSTTTNVLFTTNNQQGGELGNIKFVNNVFKNGRVFIEGTDDATQDIYVHDITFDGNVFDARDITDYVYGIYVSWLSDRDLDRFVIKNNQFIRASDTSQSGSNRAIYFRLSSDSDTGANINDIIVEGNTARNTGNFLSMMDANEGRYNITNVVVKDNKVDAFDSFLETDEVAKNIQIIDNTIYGCDYIIEGAASNIVFDGNIINDTTCPMTSATSATNINNGSNWRYNTTTKGYQLIEPPALVYYNTTQFSISGGGLNILHEWLASIISPIASALGFINSTQLQNETIVRSYNTSWKVTNSTNADLLGGQAPSFYLDITSKVGNTTKEIRDTVNNSGTYNFSGIGMTAGNITFGNCNIGWNGSCMIQTCTGTTNTRTINCPG